MKTTTTMVAILLASMAVLPDAFGQNPDRKSFENRLYSITQIATFGLDDERFALLSPNNKRNLLACRDVLVALLRGIEKNEPTLRYLTPELARRYGTALAARLVGLETSIDAVGVTDFAFVDGETSIRLDFFVLVYKEGVIAVFEKSATLKRSGSEWRVASFD
jgi:hypothetical protein